MAERPEFKIYTKLPQKVKSEPYTPNQDDVRKILEAAKGTMFEIPISLACYGMRRSEICALTLDELLCQSNVGAGCAGCGYHEVGWLAE